jgi:hypothetical protein
VNPATGIRNWDNPDWRDDDLDGKSNSVDPYPNNECAVDTTQDADCNGTRDDPADRDRLVAAGNTEMVRQWDCSRFNTPRYCDVTWVDDEAGLGRLLRGDENAAPATATPSAVAATPTVTPQPTPPMVPVVGGTLDPWPPPDGDPILDLGGIRRAVDGLFTTQAAQIASAVLNVPRTAIGLLGFMETSRVQGWRLRDCHMALDAVIECTGAGLMSATGTFGKGAGGVIVLDDDMSPAMRALTREHEVRHTQQWGLLGPALTNLVNDIGMIGALVRPGPYKDCANLLEMEAEDFVKARQSSLAGSYSRCEVIWDHATVGGRQVIDIK